MRTAFSRPIARVRVSILIVALLAATALLVLIPLAVIVIAHKAGYEEKAWTQQSGVTVTVDGTIDTINEWWDTPQVVVSGLTGQSQALNLRFKQNGTNLYIAVNKTSIGGNQNMVTYFFDVNHNGTLDTSDRGAQLENGGGSTAMTATCYPGGSGSWGAGQLCSTLWSTWSFSRNGDSYEASIPLSEIGLGSTGNSAGFMMLTCDKTTNKERVGWPDYISTGVGACAALPSVPNATTPTEWGNLTRTSETYPGVSDAQTSWGSFTFGNYTYRGQAIYDWETSHDPSHGPAAVQPTDIDIASSTVNAPPGSATSVEYAFYSNGTTATSACDTNRKDDKVAFRLWLDGDPHFKTGYKSRHWNILLDVDGDGYKEFWLDLSGDYSQNGPDVLKLYYENLSRQDLTSTTSTLKYVFPADSISGSSTSFVRYGSQARTGEGGELDYYIDMQIPVKYLDLADDGSENCSVSSATRLSAFYSTSASNTNPLQKDWMMDPGGLAASWTPDQTLIFGDKSTLDPKAGGNFSLTPLAYNETIGPGTVLNFAHVLKDQNTSGSKTYTFSTITAGTCGTVTLYEDTNGNGVRDSTETTVLSSKSISFGGTQYFVAEVTAGSSGSCQIDVSVNDGTNTKTADDDYTVSQTSSAVKINELMYDPATGNEWLEITNASQYFSANVDNWVISDNDGNIYTIPDIPNLPSSSSCGGDEARIVIVFGTGSNNTTNPCVMTLYTGSSGWFEDNADDVSLCAGSCSSTTIVDYLAYGADAGSDDDNAVSAGIWTGQTYAADVPTGHSLSRMRTADLRDGYDTNKYTDWYDANAPSPGEENTPHIVINEVEFDTASVDWAELYVVEDGVAGDFGVDISGYMLTDLDGTDTAFATSTTTVVSGDYVRIWWGSGTDETDSYCLTAACGPYRDLYVSDTAPNVSTDDGLALATAASGGQYVDAVVWDGQGDGDNTWCTTCGDGGTSEAADVSTLVNYTINGIGVPMWNSASDGSGVNGDTQTGGTTIGRDAVSTDTGALGDWDDNGGKDAVSETPGARNVGVIVNEVMFNPLTGNEWVEVYCGTAVNFATTNYRLEFGSGGSYNVTSGSCTAGGYLQVDLGSSPNLSNTSDAVSLCSGTSACSISTIKDFVAYGADPGTADTTAVSAGIWTDGDYVSIGGISQGETIGRDKDQTETNRSLDWETHGGADAVGPTPGAQNIGSRLIFNEVMFDPSTGRDYIEIYNPTVSSVSLTGYVIQDGSGDGISGGFTIPQYDTDGDGAVDDNLTIPAGEYLVIYLDDGGSTGSDDYSWDDGDYAELHINFESGTDNLGTSDSLSLCSAACASGTIKDFIAWGADPGTDDATAVAAGIWDDGDYINTSAVTAGESIGRDKDSTDINQPADWADHGGADAVGTTQGVRNIGSVVINEVSYKNSTADWVELYNPTDTALDLDSFCLSLDDGGTCYNFPDGLQRIPAGEYLIIRFGVGTDDLSWSDGDIAVIYTCGSDSCAGGELSSLSDTSQAISLYNSDTTRNNTTIVDFVAYGADPGTNDTDAVAAGLWTDGAFVSVAVAAGETIGRDKNSTDTNTTSDWAGTGGVDATQATYGYRNFTNVFTPGPTAIILLTFHAKGIFAQPVWLPAALILSGLAGLIWLAGIGLYIHKRNQPAPARRRKV